jgi:GT2 family glycosyltransferase/glycosyltransferase involved in cell wall biosynthesis
MKTKKKKKILVISKAPPLHDRNGAGNRLFQLLRLLAEENDVTFLSTWHAVLHKFKEKPVAYLVRDGTFSREHIEFLDDAYLADLREEGIRTLNSADPVPFTVRPTNDYDIRPFLRAERYDAVWLEYFYLADQYVDLLRQFQPQAEVIVDTVDLHFLRQERQVRYLETQVKYSVNAEQEKSPLGPGFAKELQDHRNYAAHVKEHELRAYGKCDRIVVTSHDDARELRAHLPYASIVVAPNVHETRRAKMPSLSSRKGAVFTGSFDHGPNSSAAIFLKHEVAPALAARGVATKFQLVGSNPPYLVRNMSKHGEHADRFRVTGHVPSILPHLDRARVAVLPVPYGSGMSAKIGEALAAGIPVVTTALGALGLGLTHGENCLVAETAEEYANVIAELETNDALWLNLSEAGRKYVAEKFSPEAVGPVFRAEIAEGLSRIAPPVAASSAPRAPAPVRLPAARFVVPKTPEISVILLTYGQWPFTELCLRSLAYAQAKSRLRVEYILVDNASRDGTAEHARRVPGLRVIANKKNLGFAAGNNVGIRAASGRNVVILNNDTVVSPGWLERLHEQARRIGNVGIVGPGTNTEPGQALFGARYNGLPELFAYNRELARANRGQWELCEKISGLCMYIPREVIEKVGLLSEDYGIGYFEDDDYCFRVRDAGFRTIWAKDTYVHHFGSVSFENSSASREKHLNYGMSQFIFKWGKRALKHIAQSHRQTLIRPVDSQLPIQN